MKKSDKTLRISNRWDRQPIIKSASKTRVWKNKEVNK